MGKFAEEIKVCGKKKCKRILAVVNTGADGNITLPKEVADEIGAEAIRKDVKVCGVNTCQKVDVREFDVEGLDGCKFDGVRGMALPGLKHALIGADLMEEMGAVVDPRKEEIIIKKCKAKEIWK